MVFLFIGKWFLPVFLGETPCLFLVYYAGDGLFMAVFTIRENRVFQRGYKKGKSFVSPVLVTYVTKGRKNQPTRIGITTSKKIGCAVRRNRARRIIKESYRLLSSGVKPGYDIIFVARLKTTFSTEPVIEKSMRKHLEAAGLFIEGSSEESSI